MPKRVIANKAKLLELRNQRLWSREEYADAAANLRLPNASTSVLAKAEGGKAVHPKTIETASQIYGIPFDELVLPEFQKNPVQAPAGDQFDAEIRRFLDRNRVTSPTHDWYIELYHSPEWRGWNRHEVIFRHVGEYPTPKELQMLMQQYVPGPPIRGYFSLHRCSPHPLADEAPHLELEAYGGSYHHVYALNKVYQHRHDDPDCARFRSKFEDSWINPDDAWPLESSPLYHNINTEIVVVSADNQVILGKRPKAVGFSPWSYSASLEEQMLRTDPDKPDRSDADPFDAAERGVREELALTVISDATKLLSLGIEWGNFTAALLFLVRCDETFNEVVECWSAAEHDPYEAIALDCFPATIDSLSRAIMSVKWSPSPRMTSKVGRLREDAGAWHPTAKARLHALLSHLRSLAE